MASAKMLGHDRGGCAQGRAVREGCRGRWGMIEGDVLRAGRSGRAVGAAGA